VVANGRGPGAQLGQGQPRPSLGHADVEHVCQRGRVDGRPVICVLPICTAARHMHMTMCEVVTHQQAGTVGVAQAQL
jgi:hypothetical protein